MADPASLSLLDELRWRGLLHQTTADQELASYLSTPGRIGYCGFDPTADSLTIGNFIAIKLLMHWQRCGHKPIVLMGGGTGLIGDPSGKDKERQLLSPEKVEENIQSQRKIFERLLDFDSSSPNSAILLNNYDWLGQLNYLEVLRDVGKHFSVNVMIQKDSVRERLHNRDQGISYTEFSYMILQAYDFLHLKREHDCTVQIAGSDQYGNIVAGIDLIRRDQVEDPKASPGFGITAPLVTKADGKKIGKTESGAVWLSAHRTSPYAFYQYWMNVDDKDVGPFLRWFTLMGREEIESVEKAHSEAPHKRDAQRALAEHMTALVHGESELERSQMAARALFGGNVRELDGDLLREVFADVPHSEHDKNALGSEGANLVEILPQTSLASSKREAREFLSNGSISVNGERVEKDKALERILTADDLLHGESILLRRGKKAWHASRWS